MAVAAALAASALGVGLAGYRQEAMPLRRNVGTLDKLEGSYHLTESRCWQACPC